MLRFGLGKPFVEMMATDHTFPRNERLKSRKEIAALFGEGRGETFYPLRCVVRREKVEEQNVGIRVLVSVSKKHHKRANVRNLLKRRIREAYRMNRNPLKDRVSGQRERLTFALLYVSKEIADFAAIDYAVRKIISKLLDQTENRG